MHQSWANDDGATYYHCPKPLVGRIGGDASHYRKKHSLISAAESHDCHLMSSDIVKMDGEKRILRSGILEDAARDGSCLREMIGGNHPMKLVGKKALIHLTMYQLMENETVNAVKSLDEFNTDHMRGRPSANSPHYIFFPSMNFSARVDDVLPLRQKIEALENQVAKLMRVVRAQGGAIRSLAAKVKRPPQQGCCYQQTSQ